METAYNKWRKKSKKSCIDYCFHMAITNWERHGPEMKKMIEMGCPTFKEFMIYESEGWQSDDRAIGLFRAEDDVLQCRRKNVALDGKHSIPTPILGLGNLIASQKLRRHAGNAGLSATMQLRSVLLPAVSVIALAITADDHNFFVTILYLVQPISLRRFGDVCIIFFAFAVIQT